MLYEKSHMFTVLSLQLGGIVLLKTHRTHTQRGLDGTGLAIRSQTTRGRSWHWQRHRSFRISLQGHKGNTGSTAFSSIRELSDQEARYPPSAPCSKETKPTPAARQSRSDPQGTRVITYIPGQFSEVGPDRTQRGSHMRCHFGYRVHGKNRTWFAH